MDRAMLLRHLEEAEEHIVVGARNIAKQREIITQLEADGHDTVRARRMLGNFQEIHAVRIAEHEQIQNELARSK